MITERINQWDYEDVEIARTVYDLYKSRGMRVWTKGSVVYWVEDSTD
jgi:hypothetical protein